MVCKQSIVITGLLGLIMATSLSSCSDDVSSDLNWEVPEVLIGKWSAEEVGIRVRKQIIIFISYTFRSGHGDIHFTINPDKTVTGAIGDATFSNGTLIKNSGDPQKTGVSYRILVGEVGKLFPEDHVELKEIEL